MGNLADELAPLCPVHASSGRSLPPSPALRPLRVMFVITCMPVGGAETLLVELIRRMNRERFSPQLCCLKYLGPMGEVLAREIPTFTGLLANKYDFAVLGRLTRLMRREEIDAVVTVGTGGDKMFWGRLAGRLARVPVICSALHSTGLPDHVELPNRLLSPITDAFIAVAQSHGRYLAEHEGCPVRKIRVIPNGVDLDRFRPLPADPRFRAELGIPPGTPVAGIVAALRPEKNHELFLESARLVGKEIPRARFLVVGDGPQRAGLEKRAAELGVADAVQFLGTRHDVAEVLSLVDVFVLTSHMEANPVSILEAMACEKPVVATSVGSVPENVLDGRTGYLAEPGDARRIADRVIRLLRDPALAAEMGRAARRHVAQHASSDRMVEGYQDLIEQIYREKAARPS
jgi:glycosyltransferase involved in cell wall biosynthesis